MNTSDRFRRKTAQALAMTVLVHLGAAWAIDDKTAESIRATNRIGDTAASLRMLDEYDKTDPDVVLLRAETYWHAGSLSAARNQIDKVPRSSGAPWLAGQELLLRIDFLEGNIDACRTLANEIAKLDNKNISAHWFGALTALRTGDHSAAMLQVETLEESGNAPIVAASLRGDVLEAMGESDGARAARESVIGLLNGTTEHSLLDAVAGARALRKMEAYEAANQCIQLAQNIDRTDPFMKLEKARVYRATQGYGIAGKTLADMTKLYGNVPEVWAELAELEWDMKSKQENVVSMANRALAGDATLLDARGRLIFYALLEDDFSKAETLIASNLEINPRHRATRNYERALAVLRSDTDGMPANEENGAFAGLMSDITMAKNRYAESLRWAKRHAEIAPDSGRALHQLGLAQFRSGRIEEAQLMLERSLAAMPYALQTKNLLQYIDGVLEGEEIGSDALRVSYPKGQSAVARFVEARAAQLLAAPPPVFWTRRVEFDPISVGRQFTRFAHHYRRHPLRLLRGSGPSGHDGRGPFRRYGVPLDLGRHLRQMGPLSTRRGHSSRGRSGAGAVRDQRNGAPLAGRGRGQSCGVAIERGMGAAESRRCVESTAVGPEVADERCGEPVSGVTEAAVSGVRPVGDPGLDETVRRKNHAELDEEDWGRRAVAHGIGIRRRQEHGGNRSGNAPQYTDDLLPHGEKS